MSRKDDLAPAEIWEAQYRAEEACAAISCETDYDMPCQTKRCDPGSCTVIQFEAARLMECDAPIQALPNKVRKKMEPTHRSRTIIREYRTPTEEHISWVMEHECVLHYSRAGRMHLGNGCFRAIKKYG